MYCVLYFFFSFVWLMENKTEKENGNRSNTYLHYPWENAKNRKTAYCYKLEVKWQP